MRLALLCVAACCPGVGAQTILFDNARVFDGERALGVRDVLVEDGTIARIATDIQPPEGAEIIDGAGHTLLPGLIDAHTHTVSPDMLQSAASLGVTTVLDMFTGGPLVPTLRNLGEQSTDHASIFTATTLMTAPGGHGTQYGLDIETVSGPDDVAGFIANRVAEGADYIKIVCEDGSVFGRDIPCIDEATLREGVRIAHEHDLLAVVHVSTLAWARRAVDAGADVLVHMFADQPATEEFIAAAAAAGIAITPTLTVLESLASIDGGAEVADDDRLSAYLTSGEVGTLMSSFIPGEPNEQQMAQLLESVRKLHQAGVPILAGTDPPNPGTAHGASLHRELTLLHRAGLTPTEALAAATSVTADVYSLDDRGRLAPGRRADLLLVTGDPTVDLDATRDIVGIWRAGMPVTRRKADTRPAVGDDDAPGTGLISAFDDGRMDAAIGAGWNVTTDAMTGGRSTCTLDVIDGGADASPGCLLAAGTISDAVDQPWAGAQLSPGPGMFRPVDLSHADGFSFKARGDGRTYAVVVFTQAGGFQPVVETFTPGDDWTAHAFTWKDLGIEQPDITAIMVSAGLPAGDFRLMIDSFRIQ